MNKNKSGFAPTLIILVVVAVAALGMGAYYGAYSISRHESVSGIDETRLTPRPICEVDSDCVLRICAGAISKEQDRKLREQGIADLPCRTYYGYKAQCVANKCVEVK